MKAVARAFIEISLRLSWQLGSPHLDETTWRQTQSLVRWTLEQRKEGVDSTALQDNHQRLQSKQGPHRATQGHTGAHRGRHPLLKSYAQGSGLDLELLGHRHYGRAVHRGTCYDPPFLDVKEAFLGAVASFYCPTKH